MHLSIFNMYRSLGMCCYISSSVSIYSSEKNCEGYDMCPHLEHTAPIFSSLEHLPIEKVFINCVAIVINKISCDMLPETMAKIYSKYKDHHTHNTRGKNLECYIKQK